MGRGLSVQTKIAKALATVGASAFPVWLRTNATVGGNTLLGIRVTTESVDLPIVPMPAVRQLSAREITAGGGLYQPGDYQFVFAGTVAREAFVDSLIVYGTQVLQIARVTESVVDGTVVAWTVVARTLMETL